MKIFILVRAHILSRNKTGTMAASRQISFGNALYRVPDLQVAKQFYSSAFEIETYFDEPTWVVFEIGNYELWLVPADSTEEHPEVYGPLDKSWELTYWEVKDIDAVYQRFIDLGGTVYKKIKRDHTPFVDAIVRDPWGNKIGLSEGPL